MKRTNYLPALLALVCILCSFGGDVKPFKDTSWIPADFDARNGVLLVEIIKLNIPQKQNDKQNEKAKELMQLEYPYKYEFASTEDIANGSKYADKTKYRWALMYSSNTVTHSTNVHNNYSVQNTSPNNIYRNSTYGNTNSVTVSSSDFHVYDRQLDKNAPETGRSNSFILNIMKPTVATLVQFTKDKKK